MLSVAWAGRPPAQATVVELRLRANCLLGSQERRAPVTAAAGSFMSEKWRPEGSRSRPAARSAFSTRSAGKVWSPAVGTSAPHATGIDGAASRSRRPNTIRNPAAQRTSPAPVIVIAATVTVGDATSNESAMRSSGATSVSTAMLTGDGVGRIDEAEVESTLGVVPPEMIALPSLPLVAVQAAARTFR